MTATKYIMATGSNVNNTGTFLARPSATDTPTTNVRRTNKMENLLIGGGSFTFEKWLRGGDGSKSWLLSRLIKVGYSSLPRDSLLHAGQPPDDVNVLKFLQLEEKVTMQHAAQKRFFLFPPIDILLPSILSLETQLFIHSNFTSGSRIFSLHLYSRKRFSLFLIGQPLNDVPLSTRAQQLTTREFTQLVSSPLRLIQEPKKNKNLI